MLKFKSKLFIVEVKNYKNWIASATLLALVAVGVVLAITSNYGSDNDTYGMIYTFHSLISGNGYVPSRFTGYPVAEVGIGFIAFYFGSWLNNLVSFAFLIISLVLIYVTLIKNVFDSKLLIFLLLAISNPVLFFDNLAPMDYSWSLFFFSLGLYFLKKQDLLFSVLFFGISVGTRPNFLFFSLMAIILFKHDKIFTNYQKFSAMFLTSFIGALFYVPIWFNSGLSLDWLTSGRPLGQGYFGLISRFVYKSWMAIGLFILPLVAYFLFRYFKQVKLSRQINLIFGLIVLNLAVYLYIPADRSYLQLAIILLLLMMVYVPWKKALIIVFLNIVSWFILLNPLTFTFKSQNPCDSVEALSAVFNPRFDEGELFLYIQGQNESVCYQNQIANRTNEINSGKRLR